MIRRLAGLACVALLALAPAARAQEAPPAALSGLMRKAAESRRITLGYRESSLPFSYLNPQRQPLGYSIDLCLEIVAELRAETGREIAVEWRPVTPETRIPELQAERIDLECGSTTSNAARAREVGFSPVFFVAGTRLLVPNASRARGLADFAGKTIVATAGTTNGEAISSLARRQGLAIDLVTEPDHAQSYARLAAGRADAFATDDVLLYGMIATAPGGDGFRVAGPLLSYEPYGLMFRRGDPAFAGLVTRTFARLAASGELGDIYDRWFNRRLPTGERLNIPMSAELTEILRVLGAPD